jgi:hypothetical protein
MFASSMLMCCKRFGGSLFEGHCLHERDGHKDKSRETLPQGKTLGDGIVIWGLAILLCDNKKNIRLVSDQ